jgi:hypothetical protein
MKPRIRRLAVIVGATALVGAAAGCGAASSNNASNANNANNANATAPAAGQRPDLSALATKLGVSTSALEKAMQATRPSQSSSSSPQNMAAALAKQLGISESKVRAAMQSLGPPSGSAPAAPSSSTTTS